MDNLKKYSGFIPYLVATIIILFIGNLLAGDTSLYADINKPTLSPPAFVFGIAWSIIYTLMIISLFLIYKSDCYECSKKTSYSIFFLQLIINIIWPAIFFNEEKFYIAFLWLLLLIVVVIFMIFEFKKVNKLAGLLQLPYLIWLIFALYLNYNIIGY